VHRKNGAPHFFVVVEENIAQPCRLPALLARNTGIGVGIEGEDETFSLRLLLKQLRRYVPAVQCSMTP
jgi:hypothetical protein